MSIINEYRKALLRWHGQAPSLHGIGKISSSQASIVVLRDLILLHDKKRLNTRWPRQIIRRQWKKTSAINEPDNFNFSRLRWRYASYTWKFNQLITSKNNGKEWRCFIESIECTSQMMLITIFHILNFPSIAFILRKSIFVSIKLNLQITCVTRYSYDFM